MGREMRDGSRDVLLYAVVRPLLFFFWSMVLWGTCMAIALLYAAMRQGPLVAVRRVLEGEDSLGGRVNLALAGLAIVVWSAVAAAVRRRRAARRPEATPSDAPT